MSSGVTKIYVVVCNGISDLGKGWLSASIGRLDPRNTIAIKIDPMLNRHFPLTLGVPIQEILPPHEIDSLLENGILESPQYTISDDFLTYKEAGMSVSPQFNILAGDLFLRFVSRPDDYIRPGEIRKKMFTDLSYFLAQEITRIATDYQASTLIIEVGGTIDDIESVYIPSAIRFLADTQLLGVRPEVVLLSYFEMAEGDLSERRFRVKTQHIRRGLVCVRNLYHDVPLKACIIRRRNVLPAITDGVLIEELRNVAYTTQVALNRLIYVPNLTATSLRANLESIGEILVNSGLFERAASR